jgi:thioredoxin 1
MISEKDKKEIESAMERKETFALYLYTPLCGTCKVGEKMLQVLYTMNPNLSLYKGDLNFLPDLARDWQVMSVPCLALIKKGQLVQKIYALGSVVELNEVLKRLEEGK